MKFYNKLFSTSLGFTFAGHFSRLPMSQWKETIHMQITVWSSPLDFFKGFSIASTISVLA
jgi:hypothetical protein